jgi:hypothetical protein
MSDPTDKRLYRRVDVVIPFGFRPVDRAVVEALSFPDLVPQARESPDPLMAMLERIDGKLDRMLDRLESYDRWPSLQETSVNLSGAGVRFGCDVPIAVGVFLEVALVLPGDRPVRICTHGEVVRQTKRGRSRGGAYESAVSFVALSDRDRESIIRYTFQVSGR